MPLGAKVGKTVKKIASGAVGAAMPEWLLPPAEDPGAAFERALAEAAAAQAPTGDGGGGGGGGGGYAAASLGSLDADPGWMGMMAEMDRASGLYGAEAARKRGLVGSERDRLLGELEPRGDLEREGIAGGYESRGLYGGGAQAQAMARQRGNQERRAVGISSDAASRISDIEGELSLQQAELERQRAQARMDYLSRGFS